MLKKNSNVNYVESVLQKKMLTTHMEREHHQNNSKPNVLEKPTIDNDKNNNIRTVLVGPSFSGKTYLMLKIFSRIPLARDIHIITKSPPEQYSNSEIKITEITEGKKPLNEYENDIIVFDGILDSSNSRDIDKFFIKVGIII